VLAEGLDFHRQGVIVAGGKIIPSGNLFLAKEPVWWMSGS
jgi:hypothetical protein